MPARPSHQFPHAPAPGKYMMHHTSLLLQAAICKLPPSTTCVVCVVYVYSTSLLQAAVPKLAPSGLVHLERHHRLVRPNRHP